MKNGIYPIYEKVKGNYNDAVLINGKSAVKTQKYLAIFGTDGIEKAPTAITRIIPFRIPHEIHRCAMPKNRTIFSVMEHSSSIKNSYHFAVEGEKDRPNFLYVDSPLGEVKSADTINQLYLRHFLERRELVDFNFSYSLDNLPPNESFISEKELLDKYDPEWKFRNWGINPSLKDLEVLASEFLWNGSGGRK